LIKRCHQARLEREEAAEDGDVTMLSGADTVPAAAMPADATKTAARPAVVKGGQESSRPQSSEPIKRKRKRGTKPARKDPDDFMDEDQSQTFRRICRDMDTVKDKTVVLDY
jgi:hypothetical protein